MRKQFIPATNFGASQKRMIHDLWFGSEMMVDCHFLSQRNRERGYHQ